LMGHLTDEIFKSATKFSEANGDPKYTAGITPDTAGFHRAYGMTLFEFYGSNQPIRERFDRAMYGWSQISGASEMLRKVYPWGQVPPNAKVCDVGGGNGHVMLGLLKAHKHLHAIVQDLPAVVEDAKKFWDTELPTAVCSKQVEFLPLDFFKETPVKGCDYYYLSHVIHDWPDAESVTVLKGVRNAMAPTSKLLIHEFAVPSLVRSNSDAVQQAAEPLLPNYGVARSFPYTVDMHMMNNLNARERTIDQFKALASKANLKINKVYDAGELSILELVPV